MSLNSLNAGIEIGSIVGGKFRMERILAEGGMGLVAAAMHLQLEQTVALKFFRGDVMTTGESRLRFMREAKAAAQLKSEHVARVLDVGVSEGGALYIVMEYLDGQGLEQIIATERTLDPASACEFAIHACEALAEAHARGIIHRDIKPSNLFLAERAPGWRAIKVLDFGVSKMSLAEASNITTNLNVVMGTPCYMSPEQLHSAAGVDHRTDIWSLGATLYQMLTGQPPFDPTLPILALAEEIASKPIPAVSDLRREVPRALSDVVARCLLRDRDRRIGSAAELAAALVPFAPPRAQLVAERAATITAMLGVGGAGARSMTPSGNASPTAVAPATARRAPEDVPTPPLPPVPSPFPPSPSYLTQLHGDSELPVFVAEPEPISGQISSWASSRAFENDPDGDSDGIAAADPGDEAPARVRLPSPTETPHEIAWARLDEEPAAVVSTALVPFGRAPIEPAEVWITPRSIAVLAAGSIMLCVFAFLILPRLVQPTRVAARRGSPSRAGSMAVAPAEATAGKSAALVIYASPPSAQIVVDGVLVTGNPYRGQFPAGGLHVVKAFASGYEPRVEQAHMTSDVVVNLSLDRSPRLPWRRPLGRTVPPRPVATTTASRGPEGSGARGAPPLVDPHGGRAPLHPIVTVSPYDAQ